MTKEKYVESYSVVSKRKEIYQMGVSAISLLLASIIICQLLIAVPPLPISKPHLLFIIPLIASIYSYSYFLRTSKRTVVLDPWIPKKLLLFLYISISTTMFLNPVSPSLTILFLLSASNIFLCHFFRQYLAGVGKNDKELNKWISSRGLWFTYPFSTTIIAICLQYLSITEFSSIRDSLLFLSYISTTMTIFIIGLYIFAAKRSTTILLQDGKVSDRVEAFYQYTDPYPINTRIDLLKNSREYLWDIGEAIIKRVLRLIREDNKRDEEFERRYIEYMGYSFAIYVVSVYVSPLLWIFLSSLPTEYVIIYPFDVGLYGLILIFYGSIFLAADPLTDLPYIDHITQPLIVAVSQLGFLLLATGTMFQISAAVDPQLLRDDAISDVLVQFDAISESTLSTVLTTAKAVAPFTVTPLSLAVLYLIAVRLKFDFDKQDKET